MRPVRKQLLASDDASVEERRAAKDRRSQEFGIEVVDGTALTPRADGPVVTTDSDMDLYGDPVNFLYPLGVRGGRTLDRNRVAAARAAFKGARGASRGGPYEQESSRRVVHTRIVEAEFEVGIIPGLDPDDDLDALLPSELFERQEAGITRGPHRAKGSPMAENNPPTPQTMDTIRRRINASRNNLGGGLPELDRAIAQARANGDEAMVTLLLAAQARVTQNHEGTQDPVPSSMSAGPARVADDPPLAPPVVTQLPPPNAVPATQFSSNDPLPPTRVAPPPAPGPAVPSSSFGPSRAPRESTGGSGVGLRRHVDLRGAGVRMFGTDDQIAAWHGKAASSRNLMREPKSRRFHGGQPWHPDDGVSR